MNKKLLISVLLCLFIFHSGIQAKEEKPKTIELVLRTDLFQEESNVFELEPPDPYIETHSFSEPISFGHVPPSPKSDELFFSVWMLSGYRWVSSPIRKIRMVNRYIIISDVIPAGIEVYTSSGYYNFQQTDIAGNLSTGRKSDWISDKWVMWRDKIGYWRVIDKNTGDPIPDDEAIYIINKLIDNGFEVQIRIGSLLQGIELISIHWYAMEVTRLSNN